MLSYQENKEWLHKLMDLLEAHFGPDVEFVLHDLTLDYEHTIVDIRNGTSLAARSAAPATFWVWNTFATRPRTTERTTTSSNTPKRARPCARPPCFCGMKTATPPCASPSTRTSPKSLELERYLHGHNRVDAEQPNEDKYRGNVNDMLQHLMDQAQLMVGKNSAHMTKEDKIRYLEFLDKHGAFLITYSNAQVCKALNISQFRSTITCA